MTASGMEHGGSDTGSRLVFGGIDVVTGGPSLPAITVDRVAAIALDERQDPGEQARLRDRAGSASARVLGAGEGVDVDDLADAGWGIAFAADADPAIVDAMGPLVALRKEQASARQEARFHLSAGPDRGIHPGQSASSFLVERHMAPGSPADPDVLPYYLLLVGGPEQIPFSFQYDLDVTYAVGRLSLPTPDAYARYAEAVVRAERAQAAASRRMVLFGPRNEDDAATAMSADRFLTPLASTLEADPVPGWSLERRIGDGVSSKEDLAGLLGGDGVPAVLLSATHGLTAPAGDVRQASQQGALVCQDWPGPAAWHGAVSRDFYLAAEDLPDATGPGGLIALLYACFSGGTPLLDDFSGMDGVPATIAAAPFLAALPQRMLGHPAAPALAVLGHVERTFDSSFAWPRAGEQLGAFQGLLTALMRGRRLGAAFEYFGDRYAALTTELMSARERAMRREPVDRDEVAWLWTARNDARNYVILGDPAVRVPTAPAATEPSA
jgi:hypothetical protein